MRRRTKNCSPTITAVLTAKAKPTTEVDTWLTWRAKAGKPASIWP